MTLQSIHNRKRKGFSLTEFAIVLSIIGVVIGALWSVVSVVRENMKRTQMKEQMYVAVNKTRDYFLSYPCATDTMTVCPTGLKLDLTDFLLRKNALPYEMLRDRTAGTWVADHPWGPVDATGSRMDNGGFRVTSGNEDGNYSDRFFSISLEGLGKDSCIGLAGKLTGTGNAPGLRYFSINGTSMKIPASPEEADEECTDINDLFFVYTLRTP